MAKFGPMVWEGHGLEVHVTPVHAPKKALARWLAERLTSRNDGQVCTRLALVRVTGTAEQEITSINLVGKTHSTKDLAGRISSQVKHTAPRKAEETFVLRAYYLDADMGIELDGPVFRWHQKVWIRIEGTDGSSIRLYESLAYARSADICLEHDATLRPRTRRRTGPRPK